MNPSDSAVCLFTLLVFTIGRGCSITADGDNLWLQLRSHRTLPGRQFVPLSHPYRRNILSSDRWRNLLSETLLRGCDESQLPARVIDVRSSQRVRPTGTAQVLVRDAGVPLIHFVPIKILRNSKHGISSGASPNGIASIVGTGQTSVPRSRAG